MWQWNSQLPTRSGVHVIAIVEPGGISCVTTCCLLTGGEAAVAHAVAEAVDVEIEAVQVHRVRLRATG